MPAFWRDAFLWRKRQNASTAAHNTPPATPPATATAVAVAAAPPPPPAWPGGGGFGGDGGGDGRGGRRGGNIPLDTESMQAMNSVESRPAPVASLTLSATCPPPSYPPTPTPSGTAIKRRPSAPPLRQPSLALGAGAIQQSSRLTANGSRLSGLCPWTLCTPTRIRGGMPVEAMMYNLV